MFKGLSKNNMKCRQCQKFIIPSKSKQNASFSQVEQDKGGGWRKTRNSLCILVPFVSRLQHQKCLATNTAQYLLAGVFSGLLC